MKQIVSILLAVIFSLFSFAQKICYTTDGKTGAIKEIRIDNDSTGMNWILKTDKTQYTWVTEKYGWGLGYLTVNGEKNEWKTPVNYESKSQEITYKTGNISIRVNRHATDNGMYESYTFKNEGKSKALLNDLGIYTPFNDNYPDAKTCMSNRCHAHIWTGDNAAYVELLRMSGQGVGLGLMVTEGKISDYDIWERGVDKSHSNFRGVIALCPNDTILESGEETTISWKIFTHNGTNDFYKKLLKYGGAIVSSPKYVYEVGETANISLETKNGKIEKSVKITTPGDITVRFNYGNGKTTYARILGVSSYEQLISKRIDFILINQQLKDSTDYRNGAFMVYDTDLHKIYKNDDKRRSDDTDEGRERVGMGILLTKWYMLHPDDNIKASLVKYAEFVRTQLQESNYRVHHSALDKNRNRGYNYPWIADFYFRMYEVTGNKQYAMDGYATMKYFFSSCGYGFYAIDIPVLKSLEVLKKAGMTQEYESLLDDYKKTAAKFIANGLNFPQHEVNYEQSIMAPATQFMAEMYLAVGDKSYLDCTKMMIKPLESFTAFQPSYHMNEIAIRHWDGYWFGKQQMFGDTYPHYWSTLNAVAYYYYAKCIGNFSFQKRAENIVRNNLCLFFENGEASCAYLNPRMVNGEKAQFYDSFANDQDWALAFYLLINNGI